MGHFQIKGGYLQFLNLVFLYLLWWTPSVLAADPPLPLGPLIDEAIKRNPSIQAAQNRWESSQAIIPQVKTLPLSEWS